MSDTGFSPDLRLRTWWAITVDGAVYETNTLKLSELEAVEDACGIGWRDLNPLNVRALQGLLYGFLCRSMSPEDAKARLSELTAADVDVELIVRPME